ncbi:MAG: T9SS type A sorting domain-containing protein [Bacteroidales bacterium]|nr:T9SS type A sorting domain-containing protein [Bacteroidales bacterium]
MINKTFTLALFFFLLAYLFSFNTQAQICHKYRLDPDTVPINTPTTFYVQEILPPGVPPGLWICNWIDFEANGIQNCTNTSSCNYTFTNNGLIPVSYQINEPFLGNLQVCTTYVYIDACNAAVVAEANNTADTLIVCQNTQIQLSAVLPLPLSCSGSWEFSWGDGNFFYDGNDFSSMTEVWHSNYQNVTYNIGLIPKTLLVKVRCTASSFCKDSSTVYLGIKPDVGNPVFGTGILTERCQGAETISISASSLNADSVVYSLDAAGILAGNQIQAGTGILTFDSLFSGTTTITATAYGCNGPKMTNYQIVTFSLPTLQLASDTSFMCLGDTLHLTGTFNGTNSFPVQLIYNTGSIPTYTINAMTNNLSLYHPCNDPQITLYFVELSDSHCTSTLNQSHYIFASPKPVYNALEDTSLCADASILLDLGAGSYDYFWNHDNSTASSALIDTSTTGINMGSNMISVTITNDYCSVTESAEVIFTICAGNFSLPEIHSNLIVYPNPTNGKVNILFSDLTHDAYRISLYDIFGRLVYREAINKICYTDYSFDIATSGQYILKIDFRDKESVVKKLTVLQP